MSTEKDVAELLAWKKMFQLKQMEMIAWQAEVMNAIGELRESGETILKGCNVLVQCDELMTQRLDNATQRIDAAAARIDVVNKRLRLLENAK